MISDLSFSPVITVLAGHADAGRVVLTDIGVFVTVGQFLVAQIAGPAGLTTTIPRSFARAVHASGIRDAFGAIWTGPTDAASACARSPATAVFPTASLRADRCNSRWSGTPIKRVCVDGTGNQFVITRDWELNCQLEPNSRSENNRYFRSRVILSLSVLAVSRPLCYFSHGFFGFGQIFWSEIVWPIVDDKLSPNCFFFQKISRKVTVFCNRSIFNHRIILSYGPNVERWTKMHSDVVTYLRS